MKPSLKNRTDLPLAIYEPFYDVTRTIFIEVPDYAVETESTQRMALAAMAQAEGASTSGPVPMEESELAVIQDSPALLHLNRQRATVSMLQSRIEVLMLYLQDVNDGVLPPDHEIMREINSLVSQLPFSQGNTNQDLPKATSNLLYREFNDILLGSYLSSLTECSSQLVNLTNSAQTLRLYSLRSRSIPAEPSSKNRAGGPRRSRH
ncbi:hypothetical protein DSO57_1039819 [Entomophthora muscae]|uniref:Uncharacterized protein n=1 Tax=Entomophthora muscae TaxID=34485 RepID=A0ACC2SH87_9FUNG|nr:hypothetical protein DSO57_1039819 [Entomophthora muscae]